ncbi:hypothetical protein RA2_00896 [Roseovarius sp. A-2]|uniref:sulfotransferase family 2 domain-containing protein n=1 Tax=Roseovarius sp. A-2 TaxID=1570360 RepID=UPI0009B52CDA|nr:sulfotransferase family 2 domain-containing protein [Roseovarius sp. A-2]GAW33851.1 hypothetical protein RA2_00896 [Roseovarius sp. A-2]
MLVFSNQRLVLLAVPKTGSTALEVALAPLASMIVRGPPELKHAPVYRYNRFFRPMIERFAGGEVAVVAVMREPVSWLGSWYRYRHRAALAGHPNSTQGISFDAFVSSYCQGKPQEFANVGAQSKFLEPQRNGTKVTHLFRYEEQDDLMDFLAERLGIRPKTAQHNASPSLGLELSDRTEARLRRKYADDFTLWQSIAGGGAYTPLPVRAKPADG